MALDRLAPETVNAAACLVRAGENELALDWLEKALEGHDPNMAAIAVAPDLDPLRDDPQLPGPQAPDLSPRSLSTV